MVIVLAVTAVAFLTHSLPLEPKIHEREHV
jgi:hypothetical protein